MKELKYKYNTSKDYELLWELTKEKRVICIVDYDEPFDDGYQIRDVCVSQVQIGNENSREIAARGICYIYARNKDKFFKQCEKYNLEFVV